MDISSVSSTQIASTYAASTTSTAKSDSTSSNKSTDDVAVVYEKSSDASSTSSTDSTKKTYTQNTELVQKLQNDQLERANQLQSLVNQIMNKQGSTYATANVFTSDFWKQFSGEDGMSIDEAAVKQAQEDVSEDGYWGAKQTSERILDFAKALTGGDPDKIDEMEEAFQKGYEEATKEWGDDLPELSKSTYDAVTAGFQAWRDEVNGTSTSEE